MDGPQNLQGPVWVGDGCIQQGCFIRSALSRSVARTSVPGGRHYSLIVLDGSTLYLHPMSERAARRFVPAVSTGSGRPSGRVPADGIEDRDLAVFQVRIELVHPGFQVPGHNLGFERSGGNAAQS